MALIKTNARSATALDATILTTKNTTATEVLQPSFCYLDSYYYTTS